MIYAKLLIITGLLLCCISSESQTKKNKLKKQMEKAIEFEADIKYNVEEKPTNNNKTFNDEDQSAEENKTFDNARLALDDATIKLKSLDETLKKRGYCRTSPALPEVKKSFEVIMEKGREVSKNLDAIKLD